jgi:hypothetical protein
MKTAIRITAGILLVLLACSIWYGVHMYNKQRNSPTTTGISSSGKLEAIVQKQVKTDAASISQEVDKNGIPHTVARLVKEIQQGDMDKVNADLLDTIAALNISRDRIKQVTQINTSLNIQNQELTKTVNDQKDAIYSFSDDNAHASVNIPRDTTKKATLKLGYNAKLVTAQYTKYAFPRGSSRYIDIYSNDKRFTIDGIKTLTVEQDRPKAEASLDAVTAFDFKTGEVMSGTRVNVRLGRLGLEGKYMRSIPGDKEWRWQVGASYNLIHF